MDIALIGGNYLTEDPENPILKDGVLIISDNKINELGKKSEIDFSGRNIEKIFLTDHHLVMPGLVNTHTHLSMTLLRGYSDDKDLHEWLEKDIFPAESVLNPDDIFLGARLGAIESALAGVTTVNSMYHSANKEADALQSVGLRGVVGNVCFSWRKKTDIQVTDELIRNYHDKGLIRVSIDPHTSYTCDPDLLLKLKEKIIKYTNKTDRKHKTDLIWHTHISETDKETQLTKEYLKNYLKDKEIEEYFENNSTLEYYEKLGLFKENDFHIPVIAAHCVHLNDKDFQVIKRNKINVSTNPISNLKLGSGIAPVPEMLKNNILVGIGTDGPSSNNSLDVFDSMRTLGLLYKGLNHDPTILKSNQVVSMATQSGAKSLGFNNLGALKKNYLADIIIINFKKPHLSPIYNYYSHLVYAVRAGDVETTIIDGKLVVEDRNPLHVDLDVLIEEIDEKKQNIMLRILENLA
ncbi:MAG: amidohydrolase [Candidatus Thorarchaeota archaeon]